eukprot:jgi/Antlo1/2224/1593
MQQIDSEMLLVCAGNLRSSTHRKRQDSVCECCRNRAVVEKHLLSCCYIQNSTAFMLLFNA